MPFDPDRPSRTSLLAALDGADTGVYLALTDLDVYDVGGLSLASGSDGLVVSRMADGDGEPATLEYVVALGD